MSKYTTDKNGITIGWDNCFSYFKLEGGLESFYSIMSFETLYAKNINSINYDLRSFATQLVWQDQEYIFPTIGWDRPRQTRKVIRSWFVNWLNKNTPGWGVPPVVAERYSECPTIFFAKVSDARKFRKFIAQQLEGMPSVNKSTLFGRKKKEEDDDE